jgi:predicted nucleotidyltransferase component of viral defense system
MIRRVEIQDKSEEWKVPPDTVDKDYVLGHLLSVFLTEMKDVILFKGGTCLKKCYWPHYRFSEDLDFSARASDFEFDLDVLERVCRTLEAQTDILLYADRIRPVLHKDTPKGFCVRIKYWGANHSRNQPPPPVERWHTMIKLEISTDEIILLAPQKNEIVHPYSDLLTGRDSALCYDLREIVAEKLRALVQRSYTAPRDFYDLYHLTREYSDTQWNEAKALFLQKMEHKRINFEGPGQLVNDNSINKVRRAWKASLDHQRDKAVDMDVMIKYVHKTVHKIF